MNSDIHVIAIGARTPVGLTADASAAAVRAGINRVSEHPFIIDRRAEPVRMAQDSYLDPKMLLLDRMTEMVADALNELGYQLTDRQDLGSVPLLLALPEERPGWTNENALELANRLRQRRLSVKFHPIEIVVEGHAAGLAALDNVCKRIHQEQMDLAVIAGVDSYAAPETLGWLDDNRQLTTSYHRNAFFPGEAAGAFAIAADSLVRRKGLRSLATIGGTGTAHEKKRIKTDAVCLGEGLTECVKKAVESLRMPDEAIEGIIGDINGERYRSEEWGFTLLHFPEILKDPTGYELPASCWGDVGAASGALFVILALSAGRRGWMKGPCYLIWSSSEGGRRAAAVLECKPASEGFQL